ncbi:sensor histidine kinase [Streptacidiphilus cavernicola]|uniref:histidine kinase n=1 Tax=Streptacidiphilus cavernicola TaxID=3342716 RepID=A0ABV6W4I5_9ACTN
MPIARVGAWWRGRPLLVRDGAFAAVLGAVAFVPGIAGDGVLLGELTVRQVDLIGVLAGLGQCLPLAVRRVAPGVCLAVIGMCFCVGQVCGYPPNFGSEGLLAALYGAGAHLGRGRRTAAVAAGAGYAVLASVLRVEGSPERAVDFVTFALVLAGCWWAGAWVRGRHAAAEQRRQLDVLAAAAAERNRIARDLHDVVTHHVTAMVVQADAAQYVLPPAGGRAAESLEAISDTGRRALAELRFLLDVLKGPGDAEAVTRTAPTRTRVADLVEQVRRTGQPVEFVQQGEQRAAGGGPELTAYRIVQEALTNALKHAPGRRTSVLADFGEAEIEIVVTTEGVTRAPGASGDGRAARGVGPLAAAGSGRGLVGLRHRVEVFGGRFSAEAMSDGGFQVRARLPLEAAP